MNRSGSIHGGCILGIAEMRRAAEAALQGAAFRRSTRMSELLTYIVDRHLAGEPDHLKETSIGVSVFGRPADYDPRIDPVVRNEARRLRRTLHRYYEDDGRGEAIRIEIPTGGYTPHFVVADQIPAPPPPPEPVIEPRRSRLPIWALAFAMALFAILLWLRTGRTAATTTDARPALPLTSFTGREVNPAISPDSRRVAFSWDPAGNYDIYTMDWGGQPKAITSNPRDELHPAWAPDGKKVAFARVAGSEFEIIVKDLADGSERRIGQVRGLEFGRPVADVTQMAGKPGPVWSPDGASLAVTNADENESGRPIQLISIRTGERRVLTHPPTNFDDLDATFSPDGKYLAFCRWQSNSLSQIYILPLDGGPVRQVTNQPADYRGIAWMPGGRELVVASNRFGAFGLWKVSLENGAMQLIPTAMTNAREPSIARDGSAIVYSEYRQHSEIWKTSTAFDAKPGTHQPLIVSTRQNHSAQVSPDGKRVAFVSDRSGSWEIWTADIAGGEARQMTHFAGPLAGTPHWSPDNQSLVFDARPSGHSALFLAKLSAPEPEVLFANHFEEKMPNWSKDGKSIYFNSNRGGSQQLWKASIATREATMLSSRFAMDSFEAPDASSVYFAGRESGIWQTRGNEARLAPGSEGFSPKRCWTVNANGLWLLDTGKAPYRVWLIENGASSAKLMATLASGALADIPSLSVSPDGHWVIYSRSKESESDLMSIRLNH